jgi:hypothetical protein
MSDVAISYKSEQRSQVYALADRLRAGGLSVWMDESAETTERTADAYGIIPGQQWVDTIKDALIDASMVLILDSAAWRRSGICRWEYDYAQYCGKRISVIQLESDDDAEVDGVAAPEATWPVSDVDDLIARFGEHADVVRAHTRVLRAATGRPVRQRLVRFLVGSSDVSDVKAVQEADPHVTGLRLNDYLQQYANDVLNRAGKRRRRLAAGAALIVVVLLAASVIAYQRQQSAEKNRNAAEESARFQQSLLLASQAIAADNTVEARRLLEEAAADTPQLRAARIQVEATAYQRTTTWIPANAPADPYIAVVLSDDARTQAVASRNAVSVFDTYTGERLKEFSVPAAVRPTMLQMTPSGDLLVGHKGSARNHIGR